MTVPAEIIDHILSFLQSDITTLRICSESHPSLSQSAERYLYSRISLSTYCQPWSDQSFSPADLAKLLSQRPHIAHYIRDLEIQAVSKTKEISYILPKLLALTKITLNLACATDRCWESQPDSFRSAFLDCLRLPSMQHVSLSNVVNFTFSSLLTDEYVSLKRLTLHSIVQKVSVVPDGSASHPDRRLPFEDISLKYCSRACIQSVTRLAETGVFQPRSLEFWSDLYELLPHLLASCSNTLTTLSLHISGRSFLYVFERDLPMMQKPLADIPVIWSKLPHLKELTLRSNFEYYRNRFKWRFYSTIPKITELFSMYRQPQSLSLKHLTLSFDCISDSDSPPEFPPSASVSDVVCIPLVELLSAVSESSSYSISSRSIQVEVLLDGIPLAGKSMREDNIFHQFLLSSLRDCENLMHYFH